ncbi:MAG: metallophosphoesterase [Candidatus Riflebacteria bacterium]
MDSTERTMKILFAADLHGHLARFEKVWEAATRHQVQAVVFGGDNFLDLHEVPLEEAVEAQQKLFDDYLPGYFQRFDAAKIHWLGILSGHDLEPFDKPLEALCARHTHIHLLEGKKIVLNGFEFIGTGLIVDTPFPPKIRCRRDTADWKVEFQFGPPHRLVEQTWHPENDWASTLANLPTLEDELASLPRPIDPQKAIYVLHHPPLGIGLDVVILDANKTPLTGDMSKRPRKEIGSMAVRHFLETQQPLLALHGHVHESPIATGIWRTNLGNTICIQPGQHTGLDQLHMVIIELPSMESQLLKE